MTLGELKRDPDLRKHGIRVLATAVDRPNDGMEAVNAITYFSDGDGKVHELVARTTSDNEEVHSEKIKALKRSLIPNWDEK